MFKLLLSVLSGLYFFALNVRNNLSFPKKLTAQEEMKLLKEKENGSVEARQKLIEHNLRLVSHITKKYYSKTGEPEELISIGTIGLIKGVDSFKSEKNTKLSTYLAKCIQNEILMHFRAGKKSAGDVYFNEPIDTDSEGNPLTFLDIVADEEDVADTIDLKIKSEKLRKYVNDMKNQREKTVIIKRFGLDGEEELTQKQVAEKLGISRSYVSRIEKKVIIDLRKKFKADEEEKDKT